MRDGPAGHSPTVHSDAECNRLAVCLFGVVPSKQVAGLYGRANARLLADVGSPADRRRIDEAIRRGSDLEALEFALRLSEPKNLLSQKAHLLAFLLEADRRTVGLFVNDRPRRRSAPFRLAGHAVRAVWKMVKGRILLRRLPSAVV